MIWWISSGGRGGRDGTDAEIEGFGGEGVVLLGRGCRCDSIDSVMFGMRTGSASKCCCGN